MSSSTSIVPLSSGPQKGNVAQLQHVALLDFGNASDQQLADAVNAQLGAASAALHKWGVIKAQTGIVLVMIRESRPHGEFGKFMDTHFSDKSRRTLRNWISAAERFCDEEGIVLNAKAVKRLAPIAETQLELFADPEAKINGLAAKFAKWTRGKSLREMMKGEPDDDDEVKTKARTLPPSPNNAGRKKQQADAATAAADALAWKKSLLELIATPLWQDLSKTDLHDVATRVTAFSDVLITAAKAMR
jgi:hypothetical protein